MSFTNRTTVRKHLVSSAIPERAVNGLPVLLEGLDPIQLPDANIVESSETVKWLIDIAPFMEGPIYMIGTKDIDLSCTHLVPGSSVVALNAGLAIVYVEELDYRVNSLEGKVARLDTGDIPNGQPVYVHYDKYEVFEAGSDYALDPTDGSLRRVTGSAIPDGATVLIDYTVQEGSVEDSTIDQAIVEAEDVIVRSLAPEYSASSTDQGLKTGATQLTLSVVARALAAESLIADRSADAPNRAREWQKLAEAWEDKAWEILAPFLDPNALRSPVVQ